MLFSGAFGVVGPLGPFGVEGVVVVDHVEQHRDAALVAGADEVLELVPPAAGKLYGHVMGGAVAPVQPILKLRHRHQLDGVDAQIDEIVEQAHGVFERALAGAAIQSQAADVHLIDDEVVETARQRPGGIELALPELLRARPPGFRPRVIAKRGRHPVGVDDHRTALAAVEILPATAPGRARGFRIDVAAADLATGVEVGAIGDRAVLTGDAEHVRRVVEPGEVGKGRIVGEVGCPDAALAAVHGDGGGHPAAVVPDVAAVDLAADELDRARVRRPDREADRGVGLVCAEKLVGAEKPAGGEVVALGLIGFAQGEDAEALARGRIVDLGRNAPEAGLAAALSTKTPQRKVWPMPLSSRLTVARKPGHPSSATKASIAVSDQACAGRPWPSQLPLSLAALISGRLRPVRYSK